LSIYKSHVAFYLKLNVQKSREAIPLSSGRGARGEVNMTSPENILQLSILGPLSPDPFLPEGTTMWRRKGSLILLKISISNSHLKSQLK
jgi:hypothetical protein